MNKNNRIYSGLYDSNNNNSNNGNNNNSINNNSRFNNNSIKYVQIKVPTLMRKNNGIN